MKRESDAARVPPFCVHFYLTVPVRLATTRRVFENPHDSPSSYYETYFAHAWRSYCKVCVFSLEACLVTNNCPYSIKLADSRSQVAGRRSPVMLLADYASTTHASNLLSIYWSRAATDKRRTCTRICCHKTTAKNKAACLIGVDLTRSPDSDMTRTPRCSTARCKSPRKQAGTPSCKTTPRDSRGQTMLMRLRKRLAVHL